MNRPLCAATKTNGEPCGRYPIKGGTVCPSHGGRAPQVRKAAEVRAARMDAEAQAQRMVARAGVDADPIEHLLESLHRAAALVEVWGEMVSKIDAEAGKETEAEGRLRGELRYEEREHEHGVDVVVTPADRMLTVNARGEARVHPYVTEYQDALERRAKFAKLCADAGVAERRVEIAEQQGQIMAQFVTGLLDKLGVERTPQVMRIVGQELRLLSGGGESAAA